MIKKKSQKHLDFILKDGELKDSYTNSILKSRWLESQQSYLSDAYEENLYLLLTMNGNKIFFSIKEVSENLNTSYDFVAERIRNNNIKSVKFGDRPMVNVKELVRIMTEGI